MTSVLVNGAPSTPDAAWIPIAAPALRYGTGVFATLRVYHGRAFLWSEQVARLCAGARMFGVEVNAGALHEDWDALGRDSEVAFRDGVLRAYVLPTDNGEYTRCLWFVAQSFPVAPVYRLRSLAHWSLPRFGLGLQPKSTSYGAYHFGRATAAGEEALAVDPDGMVRECATANLFLRRGRELVTPSVHLGILAGCVRAWVIRRAPELGFTVRESVFSTRALLDADEVFLTSALKECASVSTVDGVDRPISVGESAVERLRERLHEEVAIGARNE